MRSGLLKLSFALCVFVAADSCLAQTGGGTASGSTASGATSGLSGGGSSNLSGQGVSGLIVPQGTSTAAQTFVGGSQTEMFVGGTSAGGNQGRSNRQFQAFQNTQTQTQGNTGTTGTPRAIRTALRVSFNFPTPSQSSLGNVGANRVSLQRFLVFRPELAGITVQQQANGVVVMTGEVQDAETRRLATGLLRIQPGVRGVRDQLTLTQK